MQLADGSCLLTTDGGVRMLTTKSERDATGSVKCRGQASAAADVALESLVGLVQRPGSSWLFIGASGALYETDEPLGNFRRSIGTPTNFQRVVGNGKTTLAATPSGELFRLNDTKWQAINIGRSRVYDIAVNDDGSALVLALPEKIFATVDGQAFTEISAGGTVGARRVGRTPEGVLGVQGVLGTIVWDPKKSPATSRTNDTIEARDVQPALDLHTVPTASAVVEGRAVLDGDRYIEIGLVDAESGTWGLSTGSFTGPLTTTPLSDTKDCVWMRVGARGRHVMTVCGKTNDEGNTLALVRTSHDGGSTFGAPLEFATADSDFLQLAVAGDGSALVTGLCKTRANASGCSGSPPVLLQTEPTSTATNSGSDKPKTNNLGTLTSILAATPPLMGLPISPAFSVDGKSAYFLARRAKDERLALFVSHDAGRTFTERALDAHPGRPSRDPEAEETGEGEPSEESFEPSDLTTLRPSDDGTLSMVLTTSHGLSYLTTDEDGHVLGMSQPPVEQALVAGYGRRVIAISSTAMLDRTVTTDIPVTAWESNDGGAMWNEIRVTHAVEREIYAGPMTATCASAGCLIGTTITRVGWEGQTDGPAINRLKHPELQKTPSVRTPFVCTLDPKTPWKRVEHVWNGPTLSTIARGRAMWSILSFDPLTSSVATTAALLPDRGEGPARVATRTMFGPASKGTTYAVDVSLQVEGYAAARVRAPEADKPNGPMRNVEVAWENYFDGTSKQTTIPDVGTFDRNDVHQIGPLYVLDTGLMSVAAGAIFVNPHSHGSGEKRLFLLDAQGKRSTPVFPEWPSLLKFGETNLHGDTAIVEGKPMAVGTVEKFLGNELGPLTMILASTEEKGLSRATAMALFLPTEANRARALDQDWTYRGATEVGVVGLVSEPRAGRASGMFLPYRAEAGFGVPIDVPTPFDLPDLPRPCKAEERRTTTRVVAHPMSGSDFMYPGHRHPVIVTEDQKDKPTVGDTLTLLTWGLVLHGTKESPCVAGWEAFGTTPIGVSAVIGGDPSQSWLFRQVQPTPSSPGLNLDRITARREDSMTEHRAMSCRFDSTATIPDVVWTQAGTFRWTTK